MMKPNSSVDRFVQMECDQGLRVSAQDQRIVSLGKITSMVPTNVLLIVKSDTKRENGEGLIELRCL